ncbi:MAG TPA: aminotransferase class I/II-fold pyridoxal phosphate-dependent enzyme [Candidatus Deferrimicrobiaceae bacterium]|nr:aminotransferase class I/II-fold pyridoxal phosphate-dependent enzyme [Candidatus Deferrimicrobiaceae bacterium]
MNDESLHPETIAAIAGRPGRSPGAPLNAPIVPASTYHHGGDPVYGRDGNPGWEALEAALGTLEHGHCVTFASGLAATTAILDELPQGGRVIAQRAPYYGVAELLRERAGRGQIELETHPALTAEGLAGTIAGAALVWIESPSNPMLDVVDLGAVIAVAKRAGALVVVDNTFATPFGQTPIALGADLVLHSVTKLIGGHSDLLLGAVVAADPAIHERLRARRSMTGATPGVLEAHLALRGLRTLPVRFERAQATARELAARLERHPRVSLVRYPGTGTIISFETAGAGDDAEAVCEATRLIVHATSLGGVESTMERRARYASERAVGTPETLIRLSVGLEHLDDLWRDLERAFAVARS